MPLTAFVSLDIVGVRLIEIDHHFSNWFYSDLWSETKLELQLGLNITSRRNKHDTNGSTSLRIVGLRLCVVMMGQYVTTLGVKATSLGVGDVTDGVQRYPKCNGIGWSEVLMAVSRHFKYMQLFLSC